MKEIISNFEKTQYDLFSDEDYSLFNKFKNYLERFSNNNLILNSENCDIFIFLYKYKNEFTDKEIITFFKQQNIYYKIINFINIINKKIQIKKNLTLEENKILKQILINKLELNIDIPQIHKCHILGNKVLEYDCFCEMIKFEMEKTLSNLIKNIDLSLNNGKFLIENTGVIGKFDRMTFNITIDNEIIQRIYQGGIKSISAYEVIFHELQHAFQEYEIKMKFINFQTMKIIKETLIRELSAKTPEDDTYYKTNYDFISYEKEASIKGFIFTLRFFDSLNVNISNNLKNEINDLINEEITKYQNDLRNIENDENFEAKETTLYEIFDFYIMKHPECLSEYSQLNIEYVIENNIVRKKNLDELVNTMLQFNINSEEYKYISEIIKLNNKNNSKSK